MTIYDNIAFAPRTFGVRKKAALDEIAKVGFDPQFGARPLRRAIQDRIENGIARLLLEGKAAPGDTVKVGTAGEDFTFDVEKPKAEQSA